MLRNRSKKVRKIIYTIDESMKEKFPTKPAEDTIEAELEYTQKLVEVSGERTNINRISESKRAIKST